MITPGDEYPLHQSSRPVRDPGTERNLYDRFFFNGYKRDGSVYFAVAFGQYPGRNIMDGAISVIVDGVQHNLRASRLLGADRLDTRVGPVASGDRRAAAPAAGDGRRRRVGLPRRPALHRPLPVVRGAALPVGPRSPHRVRHHPAHPERHLVGHDHGRRHRVVDLDDAQWWGTRDRSWGVRPIGEREGGAIDGPLGFYWLWAPLNFDDGGFLFDVNEYPDGSRWHHSAMWAPAGPLDAPVEQGSAEYTFDYRSGTRHAEHFELRFTLPSGERKVSLEPLYNFYMQGIGYTHPHVGPRLLRRRRRAGLRHDGDRRRRRDGAVQPARADAVPGQRDDGAVGIGILEQLIIGPHAPSGLNDLLDPHA